jgi:hypothetical protein
MWALTCVQGVFRVGTRQETCGHYPVCRGYSEWVRAKRHVGVNLCAGGIQNGYPPRDMWALICQVRRPGVQGVFRVGTSQRACALHD